VKTLDKYLFKKFLSTYVFTVFIIVLIIVVIDFVEKNDNFLENQAPMRAILLEYYLNLAPYWANYVSPLMIFISTVFFTAKLASHTEIIAILSSGISFLRLMLPYFMGALVVALFSFVMVGWILPKANKKRLAFEDKYIEQQVFDDRDFHMALKKNKYVYLSSYDKLNKTAYDISLETFKDNQLIEKLHAKRAVYVDSIKKWKLFDYRIRKIGIMKDALIFGGENISMDTTIQLYPSDLEAFKNKQETMSIPELARHINLTNERGAEGVEVFLLEYYQRFATPFSVIILSIMGLIVSARKSRGGVGVQIAVGFVLAFIYILFFLISKGIAESGDMHPMLAVWLPNIVFTGVGVIMYYTVPR
jgi:lipopolysaccharide export system permease protein